MLIISFFFLSGDFKFERKWGKIFIGYVKLEVEDKSILFFYFD